MFYGHATLHTLMSLFTTGGITRFTWGTQVALPDLAGGHRWHYQIYLGDTGGITRFTWGTQVELPDLPRGLLFSDNSGSLHCNIMILKSVFLT